MNAATESLRGNEEIEIIKRKAEQGSGEVVAILDPAEVKRAMLGLLNSLRFVSFGSLMPGSAPKPSDFARYLDASYQMSGFEAELVDGKLRVTPPVLRMSQTIAFSFRTTEDDQ